MPVAIEIAVVLDPLSISFSKDLIATLLGSQERTFIQRLSVTVQRGNATTSVLGTTGLSIYSNFCFCLG